MDFIEKNFLSLAKAINVLSHRYDNFCLPMKGSYSYDMIGECKGKLHKIKVIHTEAKAPSGAYVVNVRTGHKNKPFDVHMCDVIFIDSPDGFYFIPSHEITQKRAISLSMFKEYLIN